MVEKITEISRVSDKEINELRQISIETFTETFSDHNTENDMATYISENLNSEKLHLELTANGSEFYFLRCNEKIAGYLKTNTGNSQTEKQHLNTLEIERIYVLKAFHGKQFGQLLLEKAITLAKQKHCSYIWLGVWEKNERAIAFYFKNQFKEFDKHIFKLGEDEQTDILMKLELN